MTILPIPINVLGMELDQWKYKSCVAEFGVGKDWATLYSIHSRDKNKGYATKVIKEAKVYYEAQGKKVGGTVALNPIMRRLYQKCGYQEYV